MLPTLLPTLLTASPTHPAPDAASGTAPDAASGTAPDAASGTAPDAANDPNLRERQKLRRKQRIYLVAIALFREHGFDKTTATDIAKFAHVSRGTFFNYYPYKEAVLLDFGAEIIAQLWQFSEEQYKTHDNPEIMLENLWRELANITIRERDLIPPLVYELINPDPVRAHTAYETLPLAKIFEGPLRRMDGLRSDLSLERMARTLADTYMMTALRWCSYMRERDLHEELAKTLRLFLHGMMAR
jgi:AcrR family transcriptional regulator